MLIVGGCLLLLLILIILWTCCTKTLCFKPRDENNNRTTQGRNHQSNNSKDSKDSKKGKALQKRDISLVENSSQWRYQGPTTTVQTAAANNDTADDGINNIPYQFSTNDRYTEQAKPNTVHDNSSHPRVYPGYVVGQGVNTTSTGLANKVLQ